MQGQYTNLNGSYKNNHQNAVKPQRFSQILVSMELSEESLQGLEGEILKRMKLNLIWKKLLNYFYMPLINNRK